jgi:hypothetical protein
MKRQAEHLQHRTPCAAVHRATNIEVAVAGFREAEGLEVQALCVIAQRRITRPVGVFEGRGNFP